MVTYIKLAPDAMDAAEVVKLCRPAELSFQQIIFNMPNVHEIEPKTDW